MTAPIDTAAPAGQRPRKRTIALMVFLVLAVIAGIAGYFYWRHARQFEETDDAFIDGNIVTVAPQIAGRISKVYVKDNQDIHAGDTVAEIDPTDFITRVHQAEAAMDAAQTRVENARATLDLVKANISASLVQAQAAREASQSGVEQAEANVEQALATVRWAEAQVQSAQADVEAAQAEATRREADVKRYESVDPRAMSQQQRDAARAAADAAAANLSAANKHKAAADAQVAQEQSKLAAAKAAVAEAKGRASQAQGVVQAAQTGPQQVAAAEAQIKTAQAAVEQAKAELEAAKQQLAYTKIVAPVTGRVTRKGVQPGQYVDAGRILLSIVQPDVWVTANFKETQLSRMHVGQKVEITVDTYRGRSFNGHIESFQSGTGARFSLMPPENATGNFVKVVQRVPVKIVFDEDAATRQLLGPGMSAVPRVRVAGDEGVPAPIASGSAPAGNVARP